MSINSNLISPPRRRGPGGRYAAAAAAPAPVAVAADAVANDDVAVAPAPADLAAAVLSAHTVSRAQDLLLSAVATSSAALSPVFEQFIKHPTDAPDPLASIYAIVESIVAVLNTQIFNLSVSVASTNLPPHQQLTALATQIQIVITRAVQSQALVPGMSATRQRSKLVALNTAVFALPGMLGSDPATPHEYSPLDRPWANAVRVALGGIAPTAPPFSANMSLSDWLDLSTVALGEAHSAVLDTAAAHLAAAAATQRVALSERLAAATDHARAAAAADAAPAALPPALIAALTEAALQVANDSALATVAATTESLLLRKLIRHIDLHNLTPERKAAYSQLCNTVVPLGSSLLAVLSSDAFAPVRKLRLLATDRLSPPSSTKGGQKGAQYGEVVAGFDAARARERLLALPVSVGGADAMTQLVDTNATASVASLEYLRSLPVDAVRAPPATADGGDPPTVTATGWDGAATSPLTPGWQVLAKVPWAATPRWFDVHAAAAHARPLFGPMLWGMSALRAGGATLHIGTSARGDSAEPYSPPAAHVHVAALSAPPPAPRSPSPALDIVRAKIASNEYLAAFPELRARLDAAACKVLWSSKADPLHPLPPPVRGVIMTTRLLSPGDYPQFKARMYNASRPQYNAVLAALPSMLTDGAWQRVLGDEASVTSPLMVAPKFDAHGVKVKDRICGDWRLPNSKVVADCELLPRIGDLIAHTMTGPVRSLFDAARAYNQFVCCALTRALYCVQVTESIKLQPLRAHFGMKNAGSVCQRAIRDILGSFASDAGPVVDPAAMNYSDELALNTDVFRYHDTRPGVSEQECAVDEVCAVFERAAASGFVLQADKLQLLQPEVNLCGVIVGQGTHRLTAERMQAIADWPLPPDPSRLVSFLAMAAHFREYIPGFANDCGALRRAVLHGRQVKWDETGVAIFERIRRGFRDAATLHQIDYNKPFIVKADMSIDGLSVSLFQRDAADVLRLVASNGRATRSYERNYGPMDLEAAAVLFGIERYPFLLIGGPDPVEVCTDNQPLAKFWQNGAQLKDPARADLRARLIAKLQGHNLKWVWTPATENVWDDTVSRAGWPAPEHIADHIALCDALFDDSHVMLAGFIDGDGTSSDDEADDDDDAAAGAHDGGTDAASSSTPAPAPSRAGAAPAPAPADAAEESAASSTIDNPDDSEYTPTPTAPRLGAGAPVMAPPAAPDASDAADAADASSELHSDDAADASDALASADLAAAARPQPPAAPAGDDAAGAGAAHDDARRAAATRMASDALGVPFAAETRAEQTAWAAAQSDDPALRRFFDAATGVSTPVQVITKREPQLDRSGRLFVRHGHNRALLLVVPATLVSPLVCATHAAMSHRAAATVYAELLRTHWWPGMAKDIERIVAECMLCQAYTRRARDPAPGASFPPVARFRAIHVDYVPMPPTSVNGVTYVGFLLVIDRATGMARFLPVTSKRGAELAAALERDWILQIGPPATITADNALETRGKAWRALCAKYKMDAVPTTSYNKQANGLVERLVQTLKRSVVVAMHNRGDRSWLADLPSILFNYICATQPARGNASPYELTFGAKPPTLAGTPHATATPARTHDPANGPQIAQAVREDLRAPAAAAAAAQAATAAARVKDIEFRVGQAVFVENTDAAEGDTALAQRQRRFGPYVVAELDPLRPRVQLRVLATGRIVRDKLKGQTGPYWVATRRLTLVQGDASKPGAGWLGAHDRGALPAGERADQLAQDRAVARSPKVLKTLRLKPAQCHGIAVGDGKVAAVVGSFLDAQAGARVIVVLSNGYATDVSAMEFPSLLTIAKHIPRSTKKEQLRAAPVLLPATQKLELKAT
jgi:transposase InsO family protein